MDMSDSRRERSVEVRDQDDSPKDERWKGAYDDLEDNGKDKSREANKHRSREKSKGSRREEKDHRSRDRERSKITDTSKERDKESKDSVKDPSRDRRKEDRDDREKDRIRDKVREKENDRDKYRDKERDRDKDRKDRSKDKEREKDKEDEKDGERGQDKERVKEKRRDREKEIDKARDRTREKEKEKTKDREKEKETHGDGEKGKDRIRERERDGDQDKERLRERDKGSRKQQDIHDRSKGSDKLQADIEDGQYRDVTKLGVASHHDKDDDIMSKHDTDDESGSRPSASELQDRIMKMKEERLKKLEDTSDVLSWVSKSRKLEEKRNAEKEKALQLSKIFEEQDNVIQGEDEDEVAAQSASHDLAGFKVLHGLDKVIEGGAVVLTLKDQSILADGDINQEIDMLENVEIGEQKRRNEAYKAAKKKTGVYDDKFNEEPGSEKKILPQYDDPATDEGITLDASGRFGGEAEKKLEELRRRIEGASVVTRFEDLNSSGKVSSDYYTTEEMLKFKKPKKKKSLRKKDKLDIDALEAEARSAGLGSGDLGSRGDGKRQALKEEQERSEAEKRSNAFQSAFIKADEASKALRMEQTITVQTEEDNPVFGDDDEDLRKSLERARKVALKKQDEGKPSGAQAIALLATSNVKNTDPATENPVSGESQENKVVFTEMEEFVWGLQLDEESHNPDAEDVFMEEDVAPATSNQEKKGEDGGWEEVKDSIEDETMADQEEEVKPDETIHENALGKGLSGALQLLKERGTLKDNVEWGGRNMDKKKSKLVGLDNDNDGKKEIRIERTDEYGRILTPKEAFRLLSHKFHGKGPGKMKQEKRMRQYQEELKVKQMKNADTPSLSVERMREAQSKMRTPYLVLSGHVKSGQTSDPRSGFATVEDFPGSLTPMLGDRKVEHFLGIKRKTESGDMLPPKKPKT